MSDVESLCETKEEYIKNILSADDNILSLIKESPQTYNTILGELKDNGSCQVILRRRIKRMLKQNQLWKLRIPGTRFGVVLLCTPEHDYKIIVADKKYALGGVNIYYMFDFDEDDDVIVLNNYWELLGPNFSKWSYSNTTLKIPKNNLRSGSGGLMKLWD